MNKIIPALDVGKEKAFELVGKLEDVSHLLAGLKIGSLLAYENKPKIIADLKEITRAPVIFDGQKLATDIPEIVKEQVDMFASAGADQIIACPMGGGNITLQAFFDRCKEYGVTPVCVIKMTHPGAERYLAANSADLILQDALQIGIKNFVYPATKPDILEKHRSILNAQKGITIKATGFKIQGGFPSQLRNLGVSEFIVGRAVYDAKDPMQAVIEIAREVNS